MLGQQSLLLPLDYLRFSLLLSQLLRMLLHFHLPLRTEYRQLLLPESLNLASMLQLAHPSLLSIHLLKTLICCELLQQLLLEVFFKTLLLGGSLSFESHLELLGLL